jgi:superfamily I DNA/RNA helicase
VPWARHVGAEELAETVQQILAAQDGPGLTAVIVPHRLATEWAHLDGSSVRVAAVRDVKGLEFDEVLLVEPGEILEESPRGLNDLYVALTRATQRLGVLHTSALPEVLNGLHEPVEC